MLKNTNLCAKIILDGLDTSVEYDVPIFVIYFNLFSNDDPAVKKDVVHVRMHHTKWVYTNQTGQCDVSHLLLANVFTPLSSCALASLPATLSTALNALPAIRPPTPPSLLVAL